MFYELFHRVLVCRGSWKISYVEPELSKQKLLYSEAISLGYQMI